MAAASQWEESEFLKTATMQQKVRFDAKRGVDDSTDDEPSPADEDKKKLAEERSSSRHTGGISGRIQKRKMPVRRPTAYVSDKSDDKDDEESNKERKADSSEAVKQSATLEDRLRELSVKYRQHQSPDRAANQGTKASCG